MGFWNYVLGVPLIAIAAGRGIPGFATLQQSSSFPSEAVPSPTFPSPLHKFYVSVTQIEHRNKSLEVTINLFWDDLEVELSQLHKKKIFITDANIDTLIFKYLQNKFLIKNSSKILPFLWVGKEIFTEKAVIYIEFENVKSLKGLFLDNQILTNSFPEQKNITNMITADKQRRTLIHTKTSSFISLF